jgi:tetratricopeptide (TPR) repeat protein
VTRLVPRCLRGTGRREEIESRNSCVRLVRLCFILALAGVLHLWGAGSAAFAVPESSGRVQIVAPDGLSTKIYSGPDLKSEALGIALHGDVLEIIRDVDPFYEVRLSDRKVNGFIRKSDTEPFKPPKPAGSFPVHLVAIALIVIAAIGGGVYFFFRARETKEAAAHAAAIPNVIRRAEELFRAGEYGEASAEFNNYLRLQGGEVRNPDVYRRLTVCYQHMEHIPEAAQSWEKMRELGGVKTLEDYALGVELMIAQGKDSAAAEIYEDLLREETDEEREQEIRRKLLALYRKLKEPRQYVKHAVRVIGSNSRSDALSTAVHYLIAEGQPDLALEADSKELITAIGREFLEDKVISPEAERIYLKCLAYDRTDLRLHKMLAKIYSRAGDFRKAVSELTILSQLDKDHADAHMEEAARLYVEVGHVSDALAEGNPIIIKKIAQIFLARSEVHTDAVATYEKVLEIQPKAVGINKMLSTVYLTRGDLAKYMAKLRLLHQIDGTNHDYLSDLALCVIDNDLIDETLKEGNRELNARVLKHLIKRGVSTDKAVALLEKLLTVESENVVVRGALVKAYERRGEPKKCFDHILRLLESHPNDRESLEKAAALALEHNLLGSVLGQGPAALVTATALEAVKRKSSSSMVREVLEAAHKLQPNHAGIAEYLRGLPAGKAAPARKPPAATPPPRAELKPPTTEVTPARSQARAPAAQRPKAPVKQPTAAAEIPRTEPTQRVNQRSVAVETPSTPPKPAPPPPAKPAPSPPAPAKPAPPPPAAKKPPVGRGGEKEKPAKSVGQTSARPLDTQQIVEYIDSSSAAHSAAVTTFVSGFDKSRGVLDYRPEELFRPATGGLAYKDTDVLLEDDWGKVLFGIEVNTNRRVLIRVLRRDLLESTSLKAFVDDVSEITFNMRHDNVLPLQEVVTGLGGVSGFIHPYLFRTLEQVVSLSKHLQFDVIMDMMRRTVAAMAFAHYYHGLDGRVRHIYHFHLHPSRILLSEDLRELRVMGFGFSQMYRNFTRASKPRWQEPGMNAATMPPEFFRSRVGTINEKAADIYALGAVMYFMATGDYPFEGPSFEDYKFGHTKMNPAPARLVNPDVPDWLDVIMLRCLEKDPTKRWDSLADLQEAFQEGEGH